MIKLAAAVDMFLLLHPSPVSLKANNEQFPYASRCMCKPPMHLEVKGLPVVGGFMRCAFGMLRPARR